MNDKDKEANKEFDLEKNKEVDKGPLKSEHINQYGKKDDKRKDRDLSRRVSDEEEW